MKGSLCARVAGKQPDQTKNMPISLHYKVTPFCFFSKVFVKYSNNFILVLKLSRSLRIADKIMERGSNGFNGLERISSSVKIRPIRSICVLFQATVLFFSRGLWPHDDQFSNFLTFFTHFLNVFDSF